MCPQEGGSCSCCVSCGEHSFRAKDGSCIYCVPTVRDDPVATKKQPPPKVRSDGTLLPVKPNSRSKAADALRREHLYRIEMGLPTGDDEGIHA